MSILALDVWAGEKRVGQLIQEDYRYSFQYHDIASLDPQRDLISLTMPVRARRYDTQILMPPFQMALPEGVLLENLRSRFGKVMNIDNDMVLLQLVGSHTIGRVRFTGPGQTVHAETHSEHALKDLLTYPEAEALFSDLMEELAPRSGISGLQPKVLWKARPGKIALLTDRYIVKSAGRDYPGLAVNEFFCLKTAKACGLTTPRFHLAENAKLLVVERFDFAEDGRQLAFEEICALLHLPSHGKYTSSYESVAELVQKVPCEPLTQARRDLFKAVTLSMLIRNGDAHLKNFGILYDDTRRKWLAPIYDLIITVFYIPKDVPALTLGGKKQWPGLEALEHFGLHTCGLRKKAVRQCLAEVQAGIKKTRPQIKRFGARHRNYRDLCEGMAGIMGSV